MIKQINNWQIKNNGTKLPTDLEFESVGITLHTLWNSCSNFYLGIEKSKLFTFCKFSGPEKHTILLVDKLYLKNRFVSEDYKHIEHIRHLVRLIPSIPRYLSKNKSLEINYVYHDKVSVSDAEYSGVGLTVEDAYNTMWLEKIRKIGFDFLNN